MKEQTIIGSHSNTITARTLKGGIQAVSTINTSEEDFDTPTVDKVIGAQGVEDSVVQMLTEVTDGNAKLTYPLGVLVHTMQNLKINGIL